MSNDLSAVIPKILAQGLMALRSNCVMPSLVNSDYSADAQKKGSTVDVSIPSAVAAKEVVPGPTPPATDDVNPTSVPVQLSQWWSADFALTDKDMKESMEGTIPMQASEAIKAIADNVNGYLFALYPQFYGYAGVAGTTPFATSTAEATQVRAILNRQLAPLNDRRLVMDPDAEANALNLRAFQDINFAVSAQDVRDGKMPQKLGFGWTMDQAVPVHESTPLTAGAATVNGVHLAGVESVSIAKATNASDLVVGDIITFAGHDQTYAVTAGTTLAVGNTPVPISPPLQQNMVGGEVMTLKASHVVNLAFHRDAIAFATRTLEDEIPAGLGSLVQSAADPVSGLTLRLEVTRQHKQTNWSFDILYGANVVRPQLGSRLAG